ncbi:MAG TPA: NYN domain-containing protein [Gemmatimonadales bacterium]|nr:NYN domain-containing protein [Gemmatimonadales bacterium]
MIQPPQGHLVRPAYKEPPAHAPNAALLIDFDNVTMAIRSDLQTELKRLLQSEIIRGKVAVQRAYADWRRYPQYIVPLSESSIDLIFAPAYGANKKNATDIRLAIDALELVFTRPEIGTFILLSGDSDFSSLVLKLKEYGKYIIGVGIRESSSDLLIQNCDEYYSYNELAGLTKESEAVYETRDPWELVVEAVKQMTAHNDVMRSDRLKQVMQEIDPSFNEKDSGYSRFSKFVTEAAHRGLVTLTKLDNGQYEIALGPQVAGAAAQPASRTAPAVRESEPHRERHSDRRRGAPPAISPAAPAAAQATPPAPAAANSGFSLSDAFGAMRQALSRLGAADRPVDAEEVRETMANMAGGETGELEPDRFPKLLREAQDANVIDVSQESGGAYVKLHESAETPSHEATHSAAHASASAVPSSSSGEASRAASAPSRSARFRRGSRGPRVAAPDIPRIGIVEMDPNFRPRAEPAPTPPPAEPIAAEADAPAHEERHDERPSRGRGGRGGQRNEHGEGRGTGSRERNGGDRGERNGGGEAGPRRSRRGGRGRGGRSRRPEGSERFEARDPQRHESHATHVTPATPAAVSPAHEPGERVDNESRRPEHSQRPPSPSPSEAAQDDGGTGESFWSRVKRGLTGGSGA